YASNTISVRFRAQNDIPYLFCRNRVRAPHGVLVGHLSSIVKIGCSIHSHAPDFASVGQDFYSRLSEQLPRNGSCCHESGRHPAREPSASPVVAEPSVL